MTPDRPADSAAVALEVRDLSVAYGKVEALHHASLKVPAGSIVTVIGPNGAGKTTLLNAVMGLLPAPFGPITVTIDPAGTFRLAWCSASTLP